MAILNAKLHNKNEKSRITLKWNTFQGDLRTILGNLRSVVPRSDLEKVKRVEDPILY